MLEPNGEEAAIELQGVSVAYDKHLPILDGCDLKVRRGETKCILGSSGAGKSTILRLVLGLIRPSKGRIKVLGTEITHLKESQFSDIRHRMGMVFQGGALFDSLSVAENVGFCPLERHGLPLSEVEDLIRKRLAYVGLEHAFDMMPSELSGGMTKRIAVARAMICSPELILYDEPTTGIDPIGVRRMLRLINRLRDDFQVTSVVVTHILQDARTIGDSMALLNKGQVVFDGTMDEMMESSDPYIQEFLAEQGL